VIGCQKAINPIGFLSGRIRLNSIGVSVNEERVVEAPAVEQLQRISAQLKQAREQSGIALEEIAAKTYIPLRLLRAMDEGKFERLPEPVFVQGFIKRYGDEVGLDGSALAKEFVIAPPALKKPAEEFLSQDPEDEAAAPAPRNKRAPNKFQVPAPLPPDPEPTAPAAEPTSVSPIVAEPAAPNPIAEPTPEPVAMPTSFANETPTPAQWQEPTRDRPTGGSKLWYWIGGGLIAALFGMAAVALIQPSPQNPNSSNSQTNSSPNSPAPKPINSTSPAVTTSPSPTPASGPVNVSVQLTDENWLEVEADGKVIDSGVFPKGTQKSWTAQKQLILSVGNAKGMTYSYNQSPPKPVGDSPNPLTLQFPPTATP
jgi:cytoskeleton protein RodZ